MRRRLRATAGTASGAKDMGGSSLRTAGPGRDHTPCARRNGRKADGRLGVRRDSPDQRKQIPARSGVKG